MLDRITNMICYVFHSVVDYVVRPSSVNGPLIDRKTINFNRNDKNYTETEERLDVF